MRKILLKFSMVSGATLVSMLLVLGIVYANEPAIKNSYMPVVSRETFDAVLARMKGEKQGIEARQATLLSERYDLANRPANGVTMNGGKPVAYSHEFGRRFAFQIGR